MYVIVVGIGQIGREVVGMLVDRKHDVVAIDKDKEACDFIHSETGALVIHGDATELRVLEEAGARKADVVITLMRLAASNLSCALIAKSLGVPRIIGRLRNPMYEQAYKLAGVNTLVRVADLLVNQILMEIEQPVVKKIATLGGGRAEIYTVRIPENARSIGMSIRDIADSRQFPTESVFIGVYSEEKDDFSIPRGDAVLRENDTVFLVSKAQFIKAAADFLISKK
ncbi:MAG TPA: TrkA family potassium uptake protein [Candidatus Krumholzibacterium sp.]|nr:TrkA family potassium uptake protein [Candidatus Krumholzibacterium sp.]